jgi:hypothetical protein
MPHHGTPPIDLFHVLDCQLPIFTQHDTGIADLAAGLGVERVLLQYQLERVSRLAECEDVGVHAGPLVPDPLLAATGLHFHPFPSPWPGLDHGSRTASPTRAVTLRGQRALELLSVNLLASLRRNELCEIEREPIGVVQRTPPPRDHRGAGD